MYDAFFLIGRLVVIVCSGLLLEQEPRRFLTKKGRMNESHFLVQFTLLMTKKVLLAGLGCSFVPEILSNAAIT